MSFQVFFQLKLSAAHITHAPSLLHLFNFLQKMHISQVILQILYPFLTHRTLFQLGRIVQSFVFAQFRLRHKHFAAIRAYQKLVSMTGAHVMTVFAQIVERFLAHVARFDNFAGVLLEMFLKSTLGFEILVTPLAGDAI